MNDDERTERQALANDLDDLAGRFRIEAAAWTHPSMRDAHAQLLANAEQCAISARLVAWGTIEREPARRTIDAAASLLRAWMHRRRRLDDMARRAQAAGLEFKPTNLHTPPTEENDR